MRNGYANYPFNYIISWYGSAFHLFPRFIPRNPISLHIIVKLITPHHPPTSGSFRFGMVNNELRNTAVWAESSLLC